MTVRLESISAQILATSEWITRGYEYLVKIRFCWKDDAPGSEALIDGEEVECEYQLIDPEIAYYEWGVPLDGTSVDVTEDWESTFSSGESPKRPEHWQVRAAQVMADTGQIFDRSEKECAIIALEESYHVEHIPTVLDMSLPEVKEAITNINPTGEDR